MGIKTKDLSKIKIYGDPILRKKALRVDKVGEEEILIVESMVETMNANEGVGLAAPQIGINKQIIVVKNDQNVIKLFNPVILEKQGEEEAEEGCLSVPEVYVKVKRASHVLVEGLNEKGQLTKIEAEGLTARILQHEIDHLSGVLIVDYASPISKVLVKKQLKKLRRL